MFGCLRNVSVYSSTYNLNSITMSENSNAPQGKQMAIGGFVLSLVTLVLCSWVFLWAVAAIVAGGSGWLMYLWLVLALLSVVLSAMGMVKLKKTGGKRGLAIAGLVIGIVASVWCIFLVMGMEVAAAAQSEFSDQLQDIDWNAIQDEMNDEMQLNWN